MDRYELERSFDGNGFTRIHTAAAAGNSPVAVHYSWEDNGPQAGNNYYRIKAMDKAGLVKYTSVVKVNFGKAVPAITIYPNPISGNNFALHLTDVEKGSYQLTVVNNLGQTVYQTRLQHAGGSATIPVNAGKLAKGLYTITMNSEGSHMSSQVIKN
jgi:hypothetical protein